MYNVGVTGSRYGTTEIQQNNFLVWLANKNILAFHHGDCTGADVTMANLIEQYYPDIHIVSHPPVNDKFRAFHDSDVVLPKQSYLDRNQSIINSCAILLAFPSGPEQVRSGTWSTIRYAKMRGCEIQIFYPNGKIEVIEAQKDLYDL